MIISSLFAIHSAYNSVQLPDKEKQDLWPELCSFH